MIKKMNTRRAGRYVLCFSEDPALELPADAGDRDRALTAARETGDWKAYIKQGAAPTFFHMDRLERGRFHQWKIWRDPNGNLMIGTDAGWIALARLALAKVENWDAESPGVVEVGKVKDKYFTVLADVAMFDDVGAAADAILVELGVAVYEQQTVTSGK